MLRRQHNKRQFSVYPYITVKYIHVLQVLNSIQVFEHKFWTKLRFRVSGLLKFMMLELMKFYDDSVHLSFCNKITEL